MAERDLALRPWRAATAPRSLWLQQALAAEEAAPAPRLRGSRDADVCVVGGGYTGLWTALRIKELDPAASVTIVEADICGGGASGRNGGIAVGWWWKLGTLSALVGREWALRLLRASLDGIYDVESFCAAHAPEAAFARDGWYWTATSPAQRGAWHSTVETIEGLGLPGWRDLSGTEVRERLGSSAQLGGVLDETAGVVQPAALARALRRVAIERGVEVLEESPVTSISPGPAADDPVSVRTAAGEVRAGRAVLAANAWMAHLPQFRRGVFTVSSDVVASEPLDDDAFARFGRPEASWSDSARMVRYARLTPDRRVALGRGGGTLAYGGRVGPAFTHSAAQEEELRRDFARLYPELADLRLTHAWAGPVERSPHGVPAFGRLGGDRRLAYAIGYSGTGIAPAALGGRILASLVLDRQDEWAELSEPLCRMQGSASLPPEPLRYVGGLLVQRSVRRGDRAEDAGRRPGAVDRALGRLAPKPVEA